MFVIINIVLWNNKDTIKLFKNQVKKKKLEFLKMNKSKNKI